MKYTLALLPLLLPLQSSFAQSAVKLSAAKEQVFVPTDCAERDICDLQQARLVRQDYSVRLPDGGTSHGTRTFAQFDTTSVASLEKYAFVNFIRGCQFGSRLAPDGTVLKDRGFMRDEFFGRGPTVFHHPEWVVDTTDEDPMYNSAADNLEQSRHALYRWNRTANSFNPATEKFFGQGTPERASLYVSDRPGTAFLNDDGTHAKNISLEFKMCLYKTQDLPRTLTPEQSLAAEPLHCFPWKSVFIYDWSKKEFSTAAETAEIDPFCLVAKEN
jgi:hypothetical protein